MDSQLPLFCRFNVRTLALIVACIEITLCSIGILYSMYNAFDIIVGSTILQFFLGIVLIILNIRLISGILKRNIVPVSQWLRVHLILFMVNNIVWISISIQYIILILTNKDKLSTNKKLLLENLLYLHGIIGGIYEVFVKTLD